MGNWISRQWNENKALLLFLMLMLCFKSSLADWNEVPTGSMKPTIVEGDRILVNKMAYDLRIPLTHVSLLKLADPARGDIIVFDSKVSGKRLVKRVIGLPGELVEMRNNKLLIDGQALRYSAVSENSLALERLTLDKTESLLGLKHQIRVTQPGSRLSNFAAIRIPNGMYLALGDNRDNSADSRVIGFIPRKEIIGRTNHVVMSLNYDDYYRPRSERFFKAL